MSALGRKLRREEHGRILFRCPGCECTHAITIEGPHAWGFNGNGDAPTFTPSILVTGTDFTPEGEAELEAWRTAGCPPLNGKRFDSVKTVCHSFVTNGQIQFLSDCTHALAGQTVPLPDFDTNGD